MLGSSERKFLRMSIQQTKIQSDLEKRLKLLHRQVYGKSENKLTYSDNITTSDISYLYQDLSKIAFLSSVAIGTQIILYFLLQNHILKFNLF